MPISCWPVVVLVHGLAAGPRGVEFHIHRERHRRRQPVLRAVLGRRGGVRSPGGKNTLLVNTFNGTAWGAWTRLAGTVNSDPAAPATATATSLRSLGGRQFFLYDLQRNLMDRARKVTAELYSAPSCGNFARNRGLRGAQLDGGSPGRERRRPDELEPIHRRSDRGRLRSCLHRQCGHRRDGVICAFTTTGSTVLANWFLPYPGSFLNLGGAVAGTPACLSADASATWPIVSSKAMTRASVPTPSRGHLGGRQLAWIQRHGRTVNGNASCAVDRGGVGVRSDRFQQRLLCRHWNNTTWSGFSKVGAVPTSERLPARR